MLLNYPIYPTVSPRIRKPLAMTPLPPTSNEVPRLQRASGWSQGRQHNSHEATASYVPHGTQQPSILEHLFTSVLLLSSPVLSLLQLIYLDFMAKHQDLAQKQLQDGK